MHGLSGLDLGVFRHGSYKLRGFTFMKYFAQHPQNGIDKQTKLKEKESNVCESGAGNVLSSRRLFSFFFCFPLFS